MNERLAPPDAAPIFVTGGSGFVGSAVIDELLGRGYRVHALTNTRSIDKPGVTSFPGGLFDGTAVAAAMAGCAAAVHLVGIIRETPGSSFASVHVIGTASVVKHAAAAGVRRLVHLSALGARPDGGSAYATSKFAAEQSVRHSGLDWTIFRPSVIHGPRGEFVRMMVDWAKGRALPYVFMPYFGVGLVGHTSRLLQPVDVRDVARAVADAVTRPDLVGQTIDLVGAVAVTWPQMYQVVSEAVTGTLRPAVGLPVWYGKLVATLLPNRWLPFNKSQVVLAGEDNVADIETVTRQLGWRPRAFPEAFREYGGQFR